MTDLHVLDAIVEPFAHRLAAGCALTIGNFDGVHAAHRAIVAATVADARAAGVPAAALTFEPHPHTVFRGAAPATFRLTSEAQKVALLVQAGLDFVVVARFEPVFASLDAHAFVEELLLGRLRARAIHVGWDFNYGRARSGDTRTLAALAGARGARVVVHDPLTLGGAPVSSTRVREALGAGDVQAAAALLGRPVVLAGPLASGWGRGKGLGAPTLNLYPDGETLLPRRGVYACRARFGAHALRAVANLGVRPTFADDPRVSLETHVLDPFPDTTLDAGTPIAVELVAHLRDERRFDGPDALRAQIGIDVAAARAVLDTAPAG